MTIWTQLDDCVRQLDEPFNRSEIIGWFRRHRPDGNESSLAVHIPGATAEVENRGQFSGRQPLLSPVGRGVYRRYRPEPRSTTDPAPEFQSAPARQRIVLVGCVKSKRSAPAQARDLYTSPWFEKRAGVRGVDSPTLVHHQCGARLAAAGHARRAV